MTTKNDKKGKEAEAAKTPKTTPEQLQKQLQESIEKFQQVNQVIEDRKHFLKKKELVLQYGESVKKEKENGSFDSSACKIIMQDGNSYRNDNVISINNVSIILEFVEFITGKIDLKVVELEKQIAL